MSGKADLASGDRATNGARPRLSPARRIGVYSVGFGLWATGGVWLLFHYVVAAHYGTPHPQEPLWMKLHGAFAFGALWLFGLLWGVHVLKGWSGGRRRWSGGGMVALLLVLTLTGYALYYSGDDDLRDVMSLVHWTVGLAAPLLFFVHYWARPAGDASGVRGAIDEERIVPLARRRGME